MKKIVLTLLAVATMTSCTFFQDNTIIEKKYSIDKNSAKEWDKTITRVVVGEALIPEWYGNENPILYLRKPREHCVL